MIQRLLIGGWVVGLLLLAGTGLALAEEPPPIQQLPHDIARLAVVWMAVPQSMYEVSRDEGPLLGLTLGTVEGGSLMVEDTVTYVTRGYRDPARPNERRPVGALLHYSF